MRHGFANAIGKFMAEGLTENEQVEAAEQIRFIRDNFGLKACANRNGPDQADHVRRDFEQHGRGRKRYRDHVSWVTGRALETSLSPGCSRLI